jgi:hypothetical protein
MSDVHTTPDREKWWLRLLRDLGALVDDLPLGERTGETYYAIDAAEIRAYLQPVLGKAFHVADEDPRTALAIEQETLRWLFFGDLSAFTNSRLLLLPSHVIEFDSHIDDLMAQNAENAKRMLEQREQIADEAARLASQPDFVRFEDILASPEKTLSQDVVNSVVDFLESHASTFRWFINTTTDSPLDRLKTLRTEGRIVLFEHATDLSTDIDEGTYNYWVTKLQSKRKNPRGAAMLDANAVALLRRANTQLRDRSARVCLITRSDAMLDLHESDEEKDRWADVGPVLRHPRAFAALRNLQGRDPADLRAHVDELVESLNLIKEAGEHITTEDEQNEFDNALARVREKWLQISSLAISADSVTEKESEDTSIADEVMRFHKFFQGVTGSAALRQQIDERRLMLIERMENSLRWRALFMAGVHNAIIARGINGATLLSCRYASFPFQLWLYSPELGQLDQLFSEAANEPAWNQITDFMKSDLFQHSTYEVHLLMAFLMGAVGQWEQAERFCLRALEKEPSSTHEAKYFLAVANRKIEHSSAKRFRNSLKLLAEATAERGYRDPRYRIEEAVQIYYWHQSQPTKHTPSMDQAIAETEAVVDDPTTPEDLRLQAFANLIDFQTRTGVIADEERGALKARVQKLKTDLENSERMRNSPYVKDAILWAEYLLERDTMTEAALEALARTFDDLSQSEEFSPDERRGVVDHAWSVRRYGKPTPA